MSIKHSLVAIIVISSLFIIGHASADDPFPAPPYASVGSVTESTTVLGMTLAIRKFESDAAIEDILQYYRELWGEGEYVESEASPWQMITSRQGDELYNVQIQYGGSRNTWGYLSISDLPGKLDSGKYQVSGGEGFPKMAGSQVINDQRSKDPGKTARTLLLYNDFSPRANATFYENHYKNKGWEAIMSQSTAPREKGYALYFRQGRQTVSITINQLDGKTSIVANEVSRGLLGR
ncbi:hypothetical protein [Sedimenticola thiotaurini]|uniref:Uncharacterized protein n=1 Tax=Sedimenticola thiotaurini TaxID=1543721 RepID=A0A0F7K0P2_9GAMM|nr:hypothetical protein [Sedimenticola thiotaurini]AKH20730.1 hypothetical protein AAY24_10600 [Sedimenticola thiotaurini]